MHVIAKHIIKTLVYVLEVNYCFIIAGTIQLLSNCVVELFSLNPQSSYQFIFVYLRQLAIHLRQAILSKTAEAVSGVYNWQFMNCMRLIASLLSNHCKTDSEAGIFY